MRITLKTLAIIGMVYGFVLSFIIQDANMIYAIASDSLTASAAELSAYLTSAGMVFGSFGLYGLARRF
jgi:hypothetical protein